MNVVKEISRINQKEIELGATGASWHDEFRDSAYIFIGGLNFELTEGDVITIFSQYGEVMDVNMPRDKETGKPRGFAFLMYEDQRSTVLAVDNLNGAKVLERTLRVDHAKNYKQPKVKNEDGEFVDAEDQSLNAKPEMIIDGNASDSSGSSAPDIDPEDPMKDYLLAKWKEEKALKKAKKAKSKSKRKDETPEERRARKERKREKKSKKAKSAVKGVEDLLSSLNRRDERDGRRGREHDSDRSRSPVNREKGRRSSSRTSRTPPPRERRRASSREHSGNRSADRYDSRSRHPQGSRHADYDSGSGGPYGRDTGSRRIRDYD